MENPYQNSWLMGGQNMGMQFPQFGGQFQQGGGQFPQLGMLGSQWGGQMGGQMPNLDPYHQLMAQWRPGLYGML